MNIKWKDSTRSWQFTIKTGKIKLSGKLTKVNKKTPFNVYCPDLGLNKYILSDDYFIKKRNNRYRYDSSNC